jgi:hypothetical protein
MGIICSFFHWSMAGLYDVGNTCDSLLVAFGPFCCKGKQLWDDDDDDHHRHT